MRFPSLRRLQRRALQALLVGALAPGIAIAAGQVIGSDETEPARMFSTPAERREAGGRHPLAEHATVAIFAEIEYTGDRLHPVGASSRVRESSFSRMLQLGLVATPRPWLDMELVYQYEADRDSERHSIDEAKVSVKVADIEAEIGTLYLPFGVYFSRFISGPLLEFGETRATGAIFSWTPGQRLHAGVFLYREKKVSAGGGAAWGYGFAVDASPHPSLKTGVSFLSNLADAGQDLPACRGDGGCKRVPGATAYAVATWDQVEVTAEYLAALRAFPHSAAGSNRPRAWNVEIALFPQSALSAALRMEGSADLQGAPRRRAGASVAWRVVRTASISVEYLHGTGPFEDASGRRVDRTERIGAQLSLAF